jgi:hypothetical protein
MDYWGAQNFDLAEFTEFLRVMHCISFDRFVELYKKLFHDGYIEYYAKTKFEYMQKRGVAALICEWDYKVLYFAIRMLVREHSI